MLLNSKHLKPQPFLISAGNHVTWQVLIYIFYNDTGNITKPIIDLARAPESALISTHHFVLNQKAQSKKDDNADESCYQLHDHTIGMPPLLKAHTQISNGITPVLFRT